MSLNEDIDTDLQTESDFITHPEGAAAVQMGTIKIDATGENGVSDEDEIEAVVKHLENYQVEIAAVSDKQKRLHDLKEVSNLVLASETISQSDVIALNHHVQQAEGLEEAPLNPVMFTQTPTRTGLTDVRMYILGLFKEADATSKELLERHLETELPHLEKIYVELVDSVVPELLVMFDELAYEAQDLQTKLSLSKVFYVYTQGANGPSETVTDLRYMNLRYPTREIYNDADGRYAPIVQVGKTYEDLFSLKCLKALFNHHSYVRGAHNGLIQALDRSYSHEEGGMLNVSDLISLCAQRKLYQVLEQLLAQLKEVESSAKASIAEYQKCDISDSDRICYTTQEILKLVTDLTSIYRISTILRQIASAAQAYFKAYRTVLEHA